MEDLGFHHMRSFVDRLPASSPALVAVAGAEEETVLKACAHAAREGIARSLLFGDEEDIRRRLEMESAPEGWLVVRPSSDPARDAARAAGRGEADILMKGFVSSGQFLRALLEEEAGLRTGGLLSHIAFFDIPGFPRLLGMSDGGINIDPDFDTRVGIVKNAGEVGHRVLGRTPRIALVAAVEKVQRNMPVTLEWAAIAKMAERGEFGDVLVDGPLGLDNAVDADAAASKGISGAVAGNADIVIVPDIQSGNLMGKTLTFIARVPMAGLVLGAHVPVVLNSRADSLAARLASVVLAAVAAGGEGP